MSTEERHHRARDGLRTAIEEASLPIASEYIEEAVEAFKSSFLPMPVVSDGHFCGSTAVRDDPSS